jgi:hypothetical protein
VPGASCRRRSPGALRARSHIARDVVHQSRTQVRFLPFVWLPGNGNRSAFRRQACADRCLWFQERHCPWASRAHRRISSCFAPLLTLHAADHLDHIQSGH